MNSILDTPSEFLSEPTIQVEKSHGRLTTRTIRIATAYENEFEFPHIVQYGILHQYTEFPSGSHEPRDEQYGFITDMSANEASPIDLLAYFRQEWTIENSSHYVRDETFDEDLCRTRTGNGPQNLATMRNLAISSLHLLGLRNIAQSVRFLAARPELIISGFGYKINHFGSLAAHAKAQKGICQSPLPVLFFPEQTTQATGTTAII